MALYSLHGIVPVVHHDAWIAPSACLIGEVTVEEGASIWFNAVIRADAGPIVIRAGANVQDCSVLHGGPDVTEVGEGATIGHSCVVHMAHVGEEALIGNNANILDGARIGARAMVAAGSVVSPGTVIPPDVLAVGTPARVRGALTPAQAHWVGSNPSAYRELARHYANGLTEVAGS